MIDVKFLQVLHRRHRQERIAPHYLGPCNREIEGTVIHSSSSDPFRLCAAKQSEEKLKSQG
jgi:hypothetical protein